MSAFRMTKKIDVCHIYIEYRSLLTVVNPFQVNPCTKYTFGTVLNHGISDDPDGLRTRFFKYAERRLMLN